MLSIHPSRWRPISHDTPPPRTVAAICCPAIVRSPTPRHQAESHTVIKHRVATAGEHGRVPVDAGHAMPAGHWPMLQAGFDGNVLGRLRQFPVAQCSQIDKPAVSTLGVVQRNAMLESS